MTASTARERQARLVGTVIADRFLVKKRIAAGGMGVVYRAEQVPLGRPVALKIMEPRTDEDSVARFTERFLLEAAAVAKLSHPNTITLFDYGETDDGLFFYAMEYVDGVNLRARVNKHGPLSPADAIHVAVQVAGSVREAHRAGMIHRDLKPGNLMITELHDDPWFVKVLDFGLVKVLGETEGLDLTQSGMLLGSPRYMAPEQVLGGTLDHRVDIYAIGAVLYFALTGHPLFSYDSKFEVMRAQVEEAPRPMGEVHPTCRASERLVACVMRCLAKDPVERFASLDELGHELLECGRELGLEEPSLSGSSRAFESGAASRESLTVAAKPSAHAALAAAEPVAATRTEPSSEPSGWGARLALAAGAGLLLSVAVAAVAFYVSPDAPPPASPPPPSAPPAEAQAVRIESEPPGARIRRGDEDLGDAPFSVEIPSGERWSLTVSLDGHETRTVSVSSGRDRLMVHLTPSPSAAPPPPEVAPEDPAAAPRAAQANRPRAPAPPTPTPRPLVQPTPTTPTPPPTTPPSAGTSRRGGNDLRDPWGR